MVNCRGFGRKRYTGLLETILLEGLRKATIACVAVGVLAKYVHKTGQNYCHY
jgi:hypothetical protein